MKHSLRLAVLALFLPLWSFSQPCTTTDGSGCVCADSGSTDCDLLPDITISEWALLNYQSGPTEYSQTGNGVNNGRLRITGSTPNIGVGPFTVGSVQMWTCGTDTFNDYNAALQVCQYPQQLVKQKIYHKNGNNMAYWERWAGSMTYHPSHGHMHVDDWGIFTLRVEDPNEPDPRNWPIVGNGAKLGFCLMDFGTCSYYNGHCRDSSNNVMLNGDFVNWGLGGGQYNCSPVEQGISVGYTDIYSENLDGMWVDIPPGTCNGDYFIVVEIDPNNNFLESNEDNNWIAVPFTLTQQVPAGQGLAQVAASGPTSLCPGESLTLTANAGSSYTWSNGATSQTITVTQPGNYTVTVTSPCGTGISAPVSVTYMNTSTAPAAQGDAVCESGSMTLSVSGTGDFDWYDAATGGNLVGTGNTFTTPTLFNSRDYFVERIETMPGDSGNVGPLDGNIGTGSYHQNNTRYLEFDAHQDFVLESVWVNAGASGNREIQVSDVNGFVVASTTVNIPQGPGRITLNLNVPMGNNLRLGLSSASTANLFRNDGGTAYPYDLQNIATITSSSAGNPYYYFFYDWKVRTADIVCSTPRTQVTAVVNALPTVALSGLNATYSDQDPAVNLMGSPSGGTFSGPGVSGNQFDPSVAGAGGPYPVVYAYTDGNGCGATDTSWVTVNTLTNVLDGAVPGAVVVSPNPHNGQFRVEFELLTAHDLRVAVHDLAGKKVLLKEIPRFQGHFSQELDVRQLAKGVYILEVAVDEQVFRTKMVYQ